MRVAVIGGGPAGLVTLKALLEAHRHFHIELIEALLFETEAAVGGTFRYRSYERGELVSSRQLTSFSDFRFSDDCPDFVSTADYCTYLEEYCTHFNLWPHIKLSTQVGKIRRNEKGGHIISFSKKGTEGEEQWHCDAIAVCSGLHVTPNIPSLKGIENVPESMHSSDFKECKQFGINKNIMVLGAGETVMDIAYLAVTSPTKSVTICYRVGFKNTPKRVPDPIIDGNIADWTETNSRLGPTPPLDTASASLFDSAYVHPALEKSRLLWDYYWLMTNCLSWLMAGRSVGFDQYVGGLPRSRQHSARAVPNKSNRAMPYISAPYRPKVKHGIEAVRARKLTLPDTETNGRQIDAASWPDFINEDGHAHFQNNGSPEYERMKNHTCKPDVIIFATGYTQVFPFLDQDYPTIHQADVRRIWKTGINDVGFIGFVRPSFGAIPPLAELQAQLWIMNLLGCLPHPVRAENDDYLLQLEKGWRLQHIVDHESYAYQMALDMGAAPSILQVAAFGTKVLATWALGPNFNTKFRLVGPWRWSGAAELMRNELWIVIRRRRSKINWVLMSLLPMSMFGFLSLLLFLVYGILDVLVWPLILLRSWYKGTSRVIPACHGQGSSLWK